MKNIFYIFLFLSSFVFAQNQKITGKVVSSSDKQPLPGASVFVPNKSVSVLGEKGTIESIGVGTVTDFDGNFSLELPKSTAQIVVSFLGFQTKIISISSSKNIYNVVLEQETNTLDEVVLTGYQKIEKRKLTSAVTQVKTQDVLQAGVASIDQLLQGQVAGMVTTVSSGSPGEIAKIRIRGTASLSGSQDPLWVVDGLPLEGNDVPDFSSMQDSDIFENASNLRGYSIAGINPEDIQDITILKDAAATAIYGARAANGVIVVTTKKGKKGEMKVNISANTFVTQRPDFHKLNLMTSAEKVDFELGILSQRDLSFNNSSKGEVYRILNDAGELSTLQNSGFESLSTETQSKISGLKNNNIDWGKLLYRNAFNKQYSASISGGGDISNYYFSLGLYDEEATTFGSGFKRYNLSFNNSYNLSQRLKIGVSVLAAQGKRTSFLSERGRFTNPSNYSRDVNPYFNPYTNGNFAYDKDVEKSGGLLHNFNILEERENTNYEIQNQSIKLILDVDFKILNDLHFISQLGIQYDGDSTEKFIGENSYYYRSIREASRYGSYSDPKFYLPKGDVIHNTDRKFFQYNVKNNFQYHLFFSNKHELDLLLGSEIRKNSDISVHTKGFGYNRQSLQTQDIIFPKASEANKSIFKSYQRAEQENAFASFYATASYTYNHRYTFFGSIRYDGSNLFGVDPKYKYLPLWAASASWLVSEEDFLKNSQILPYLRLRASYGLQGNIDKNTSPFVVGTYENYSFFSSVPVITVMSPPNDKLRWEKTQNYNFGFDAGFFNNRVRLSADIYKRISSDLIGTRALPLENGFNYTSVNWAKISNRGFEVTLTTQNIKTHDFLWTTSFSLAHNKSNVDRMQVSENDRMPSREGLPVNSVFMLKTNGLDSKGLPVFIDENGNDVSLVERFKLYDEWGIGLSLTRLSPSEIRDLYSYVGDRDPKFNGGISNTFKYKNFDFSVSTSFNIKQTMVRTAPYNPTQIYTGTNYSRDVLNAWSLTNQDSQLPRIIGADTLPDVDDFIAYNWLAGQDAASNVSTISQLDIWAKQMSYLRVNSIRFGYSLPKNVIEKLGIDALRFSLEGRNLFVFSTDYSGFFDPETFGNIYTQPITKSVSFGVNVSF